MTLYQQARQLQHRLRVVNRRLSRVETLWHLEADPDRRFGLALQAHDLHLQADRLNGRLGSLI